MKNVVLFKRRSHREVFWDGRFTDKTGAPCQTADLTRAKTFQDVQEAYRVGGESGLRDWRVGKRR